MDYPLIHLAEFEWDGKLLRYKTGIQIGKQKPKDHSHLNSFFFNTGSCFTNGAVIHMDWRQIGFKSVAIWKMIRYKSWQYYNSQSYSFVTYFQTFWRKAFATGDFGYTILPLSQQQITRKFGAILLCIWTHLVTEFEAILPRISKPYFYQFTTKVEAVLRTTL